MFFQRTTEGLKSYLPKTMKNKGFYLQKTGFLDVFRYQKQGFSWFWVPQVERKPQTEQTAPPLRDLRGSVFHLIMLRLGSLTSKSARRAMERPNGFVLKRFSNLLERKPKVFVFFLVRKPKQKSHSPSVSLPKRGLDLFGFNLF